MTEQEFNEIYFPKYRGVIKALARKIARRDQDLYEDLRSVGMIALWQMDPSKATQNEDAFIRQVLYNKMADVLRRDRPELYVSLTSRLAAGDQLYSDPSTGEARLLYAGRPQHDPPPTEGLDEDEEG